MFSQRPIKKEKHLSKGNLKHNCFFRFFLSVSFAVLDDNNKHNTYCCLNEKDAIQ